MPVGRQPRFRPTFPSRPARAPPVWLTSGPRMSAPLLLATASSLSSANRPAPPVGAFLRPHARRLSLSGRWPPPVGPVPNLPARASRARVRRELAVSSTPAAASPLRIAIARETLSAPSSWSLSPSPCAYKSNPAAPHPPPNPNSAAPLEASPASDPEPIPQPEALPGASCPHLPHRQRMRNPRR